MWNAAAASALWLVLRGQDKTSVCPADRIASERVERVDRVA